MGTLVSVNVQTPILRSRQLRREARQSYQKSRCKLQNSELLLADRCKKKKKKLEYKRRFEMKTYAVLRTSGCIPYSFAKMKEVMDCGTAACHRWNKPVNLLYTVGHNSLDLNILSYIFEIKHDIWIFFKRYCYMLYVCMYVCIMLW